jgi:hypothetical protein
MGNQCPGLRRWQIRVLREAVSYGQREDKQVEISFPEAVVSTLGLLLEQHPLS